MLQPRLSWPGSDLNHSLASLTSALRHFNFCTRHQVQGPPSIFVRHATHAAQGRANGPKDSAGRRLGAKKTASQYVIPGNIIFRQRGTKWFPGENVGMGKDHTIYATVAGYVRYYKNPSLHPKRRYIGVALEKEGRGSKLPSPANAPTRRRLGMHAAPIKNDHVEFLEAHLSENSMDSALTPVVKAETSAVLKPGTYWESNYEIGKAAEKKGIRVREYDRKDRWLAWRKRSKKIKEGILAKAARATRKAKGKKTNKGAIRRK